MKKSENIKLSENIELILNILENCRLDSQIYETALKEAENNQEDILHEIEGINDYEKLPPNYKQRAALATQLQNARIDRRIAKDYIKLNRPLLEFINSEIGAKAINLLKIRLGEVRKVENTMNIRRYYKRASVKNNKTKT